MDDMCQLQEEGLHLNPAALRKVELPHVCQPYVLLNPRRICEAPQPTGYIGQVMLRQSSNIRSTRLRCAVQEVWIVLLPCS